MNHWMALLTLLPAVAAAAPRGTAAEPLRAGVAKVDVTDPMATRVHDPCYAKALVLNQGEVTVALVTVDAVAVGGIGPIPDAFMGALRDELARDPGIPPGHVIVNASHCHGSARKDADRLAARAVRKAWKGLTPVRVGTGAATEDRISENRRVTLKDGSQADMRRAYPLPWDGDIASVGPIDPQVGLVRLDREDGHPLAVLYNFACHPIMNPPSAGSSADFPGVASAAVERALGGDALAFFVQGCGGDINPVRYKNVDRPPDAEPLGALLGARVLEAARQIAVAPGGTLAVRHRIVTLPRAADYQQRIGAIEAERGRLVGSLKGTNLNFKTFLPLLIRQRLDPEFPSDAAPAYRHEQGLGRDALARLDAENRAQVEAYLGNVRVMEHLTRLNTNLDLLRAHRAKAEAAGSRTLDAEVCALRLGDFKLVTFPGELTVEVGLNLKKAANDPLAFVAGYTNGYIHYTPTAAQRANTGYAQEDCDCLVAPEWQGVFESNALELLRGL